MNFKSKMRNAKERKGSKISEDNIFTKNRTKRELKSIINKISNKKISHQICFFLIKLFVESQEKSLNIVDIYNHIISIYNLNPENLLTNSNEKFKNIKSIKASIMKLIKKNKIFTSSKGLYELNQEEALLYLKSQNTNNVNSESKNSTCPNRNKDKDKESKLQSKAKRIDSQISYSADTIYQNKFKKSPDKAGKKEHKGNSIKIKKENIKIKEEEQVNIKKENTIKTEENIKSEACENEESDKEDLFEAKLYDNFYLSFSEEGLFEQLQEKTENLLKNYNENKIGNNNIFNVSGVINKIKEIKNLLEQLNKFKENYDKYTSEVEQKREYVKFYNQILKLEGKGMEFSKKITSNLDIVDFEIKENSINMYNYSKSKHDEFYKDFINMLQEIQNMLKIINITKDNIKNKLNEIVDYLKKYNINIDNANEFYDLFNGLKDLNYLPIEKENIYEKIIEKYDLKLIEYEEKLRNENII